MSIFGLRNKAKELVKNVLGLEEEDTKVHWDDSPPPRVEKEVAEPEMAVMQEAAPVVEEEPVQEEEQIEASEVPAASTEEGLPLTLENVQEVFDDYVRPGLQSDGGDITLIKIEENDVYVKLVGACSTCPSSVMTMKMGVEALMKEEFPSMRELIDITSEEA